MKKKKLTTFEIISIILIAVFGLSTLVLGLHAFSSNKINTELNERNTELNEKLYQLEKENSDLKQLKIMTQEYPDMTGGSNGEIPVILYNPDNQIGKVMDINKIRFNVIKGSEVITLNDIIDVSSRIIGPAANETIIIPYETSNPKYDTSVIIEACLEEIDECNNIQFTVLGNENLGEENIK